MTAQTLYDKLFGGHVVREQPDGSVLLYIDRVLLHEVTSSQAFGGLQAAQRQPWRRDALFAVPDHQVPTEGRAQGLDGFSDRLAREQVESLEHYCQHYGIPQFRLTDRRQGIVHVVGPEQGLSLPGTTLVCGDSHTSTHGALAALAMGIGSSELEHVLATQCLLARKARNLRVNIEGTLAPGITAKDLALHVIGQLGIAGATGHAVEYAGATVRQLDMAGRFTLCNMTIEAGARTGLVAYDEVTEAYVHGRPQAPAGSLWIAASDQWRRALQSDADARFERELNLDAAQVAPLVTWGTKPDQVIPIDGRIPLPAQARSAVEQSDWEQALAYMDLRPGQALEGLPIDKVFIGSCTNSRIEDLRAAAAVIHGRRRAASVKRVLVVPGSGLVKAQAEAEGLDQVFRTAGFEWRDAGCSMCNAMNPDQLLPRERCASTSNRNFESRQGYRGRTHLVSPVMAAAAAVAGCLVDVRQLAAA